MAEDFEKINKQVAAFIVVTTALSVPAMVESPLASVSADPSMITVDSKVLRYAGPVNPEVYMRIDNLPEAVRYAGPVNPAVFTPDVVNSSAINQTMINSENASKLDSQLPKADVNLNTNNINVKPNTDFGGQQLGPGHFLFR